MSPCGVGPPQRTLAGRDNQEKEAHLRQIHILPALVAQHVPALHLNPSPVLDLLLAPDAYPRPWLA